MYQDIKLYGAFGGVELDLRGLKDYQYPGPTYKML